MTIATIVTIATITAAKYIPTNSPNIPIRKPRTPHHRIPLHRRPIAKPQPRTRVSSRLHISFYAYLPLGQERNVGIERDVVAAGALGEVVLEVRVGVAAVDEGEAGFSEGGVAVAIFMKSKRG